jgi:hypothetical protein
MERWLFSASGSSVTISNPDSLSSSETGVNPVIRSWKKHLSEWDRGQKAIGGIYFTKKWRAETLQPGVEFDSFEPRLRSCIFKCISWLNGDFLKWWSGLYETVESSPNQTRQFRLLTRQIVFLFFFLFLIIHSLWVRYGELNERNMGALVPGTQAEAIKKNATPLVTERVFIFRKASRQYWRRRNGVTLAKDDERPTTMGTETCPEQHSFAPKLDRDHHCGHLYSLMNDWRTVFGPDELAVDTCTPNKGQRWTISFW